MKPLFAILLLFLAISLPSATFAKRTDKRVVIGAERLLTNEFLQLIKGKRIGLVTNHTGLLPDGRHLVDVLHARNDVKLTTLFGPEHGIRGDQDTHVASGTDAKTGLPVISLYGKTRKPTPEMLQNVDVLIFDIQDIGARFYTYIATMNHVLEAAAEQGKPYIVLDRPNAIGAVYVDGPIGGEPGEPVSGVGQLPVVHGMTVGELATMFNGERAKRKLPLAKLTVIPMQHYSRTQWYDDTQLPWVKPSPNMLTLTTATVYPATCLLEGTNISEARGTLHPFEHIAAPWMDGKKLSDQLNSYGLKGVTFRPASFVPDSIVDGIKIYPPKFMGEQCTGAEMVVTDRNAFASAKAGVYILHALKTLYPEQLEWREGRMDKLWGTPKVREQLQAGVSPKEIVKQWDKDLERFKKVRKQYLLY
ncbi:exo-beta-N-acetylmuramidase NamZ domain-containing protein [Pontibacter litorisediminis]|uniref:exo-beta-N-acetylmuramidase NamZ family protein n=1 Tax=Pontibacter litorisediminis TaxID=1846260 RepID=UPI0023ED1BDA|nr:exo-beta-N-acetylmuramidase NamZ domain-containing protein [Pontibacter litorisediminis]